MDSPFDGLAGRHHMAIHFSIFAPEQGVAVWVGECDDIGAFHVWEACP